MTRRDIKPNDRPSTRPMLPADRLAYSPITERARGAQIVDWYRACGPKAP